MLKPLRRLQPSYYETFRCVGSECEDTCCRGWRVPVDKETYERYQTCSHQDLGPRLREFVQISTNRASDESHAEIKLAEGACPFLRDKLCEVHATLGEQMLSKNCATYPRVMYEVDGVLERSLDLSCPTAARLALANPEPMRFVECERDDQSRLGSVGIVDTTNSAHPGKPYRHVHEVRGLMISLLQNRGYPLSQRLIVLGRLCEKLEAEGAEEGCEELRHLSTSPPPARDEKLAPEARFEIIIELILARIGSDATSRRFLDFYQRFMAGLDWTMDSTLEKLAVRLNCALAGPYTRFIARNEFVLENYLVAGVFKNLFPFGSQSLNQKLAAYNYLHSISRQYQLLVVDFVIVETLLAGLSKLQGSFELDNAIQLLQSATKTFEHSLAYPGKALDLLAAKGLTTAASMSVLIRD